MIKSVENPNYESSGCEDNGLEINHRESTSNIVKFNHFSSMHRTSTGDTKSQTLRNRAVSHKIIPINSPKTDKPQHKRRNSILPKITDSSKFRKQMRSQMKEVIQSLAIIQIVSGEDSYSQKLMEKARKKISRQLKQSRKEIHLNNHNRVESLLKSEAVLNNALYN